MTVSSNAAIPGAEALSIKVRLIRDNDFGQIFGVFVAEMAGKPKANGSAVVWRQRLAIHAVGEQRLRMKGVGHIDAVPQYAHDSGILILVGMNPTYLASGRVLTRSKMWDSRTPVHSAM